MFSDPFTAVMALILLAFIGTLVVFLRIWRELDSLRALIEELRDGIRLYAVDASRQNRDISAALREIRANAGDSAKPRERADGVCLGELLEKGLPDISDASGQISESRLTLGFSEQEEDEDLIRRLGDGLNKETGQK